jgi:hypothetical protein
LIRESGRLGKSIRLGLRAREGIVSDLYQDLKAQLEALQRQVADLQRQAERQAQQPPAPRRGGLWLAALAVALVAGLFAGQAPLMSWAGGSQPPDRGGPPGDRLKQPEPGKGDDLVCKSLKIVNADGKERMVLSSTERGGLITVYGHDGLPRVVLDIDNDGGVVRVKAPNGTAEGILCLDNGAKNGLLRLRSNKGGNVVYLGGDDFGGTVGFNSPEGKARLTMYSGSPTVPGGLINLFNGDTKVTGIFGPDKDGRCVLNLRNADGKALVSLSSNNDGGLIDVLNQEGKLRTTMWTNNNGAKGLLTIYGDKHQDPLIYLGHTEVGGSVVLRNDDGKLQAGMWAGNKGGSGGILNLRGADSGKDSIILDAGKTTGSMSLRNDKGTELLYLGYDKNGNGLFDLRGNDNTTRVLMGLDPNAIGAIECRDGNGALKGRLPN